MRVWGDHSLGYLCIWVGHCTHSWDLELNTRREIHYLCEHMYHSPSHIHANWAKAAVWSLDFLSFGRNKVLSPLDLPVCFLSKKCCFSSISSWGPDSQCHTAGILVHTLHCNTLQCCLPAVSQAYQELWLIDSQVHWSEALASTLVHCRGWLVWQGHKRAW